MKKEDLYKILSHKTEETESAGALLASTIQKNDFVALYGDLGAGKTAFVRGFASILAPDADVCSPTYSIVNEYEGKKQKICHFDVYRIDSEDDLYSCGFYDYKDCVMIVEWCEKIPYALPPSYVKVSISKIDENTRMITMERITR